MKGLECIPANTPLAAIGHLDGAGTTSSLSDVNTGVKTPLTLGTDNLKDVYLHKPKDCYRCAPQGRGADNVCSRSYC